MADRWLQSPFGAVPLMSYSRAVVLTPSDSADLANVAAALWVGGAGNISLDTPDGTTVLISGIPAGTVLPVRVRRVRSTSTTATLIVGLD